MRKVVFQQLYGKLEILYRHSVIEGMAEKRDAEYSAMEYYQS